MPKPFKAIKNLYENVFFFADNDQNIQGQQKLPELESQEQPEPQAMDPSGTNDLAPAQSSGHSVHAGIQRSISVLRLGSFSQFLLFIYFEIQWRCQQPWRSLQRLK